MSKYGNDIKSLNEYSLVLTKPTVIHNYGNKPYFPLWILFDFFFFFGNRILFAYIPCIKAMH